MEIVRFIKRCWWWKRHTKVKLWSTKTIGYYGGYYECRSEQNAADLAYMKSWNTPKANEAEKLYERKCAEILKKYFGPKFIKA